MKSTSLILLFILAGIQLFGQSATPKVLVVGIDGVTPEALMSAETPHFDLLMQNGIHSMDAFTDYPTVTFPGFASMICGVWNEKHQVFSNFPTGNEFDDYPMFLKRIEEYDSSLFTMTIARPPFEALFEHAHDVLDTAFYFNFDATIRNYAVGYLQTQDPDAMFVYYYGPDHTGHIHGYGSHIPQYITEIETIDYYIGQMLDAIALRPTRHQENWMIILSTDHGGYDIGHGGATRIERNVFFIAAADSMGHQDLSKDTIVSIVDSALAFTGQQNQFAYIQPNTDYDFGSTTDFTVEAWIRPDATNNLELFLSNQQVTNFKSNGFTLAYDYNNSKVWFVHVADGSKNLAVGGGPLRTNELQHVAFTVDRDGLLTLYQDGIVHDGIYIGHFNNLSSPRPLGIGQDGVGGSPGSLDGNIMEIRIWNTLVSENALSEYANKPLDENHPHKDNLVGYWKGDEVVNGTLIDHSDNQNHAVMYDPTMDVSEVNLTLRTLDISNTPRIVDVAYSALRHMCIPIDSAWGLDGRTWATTNDCQFESCTDGVQNGLETGIDCGGNCPPCVSCFDGIQNGNETGIDCGGDCSPCPDLCVNTTIDSSDFETGWEFWSPGGVDCSRSFSYAPFAINNYCVRLRDNSTTSNLTSFSINTSNLDEIEVSFSYLTVSMDDPTDDFMLQVSYNGTNFTTVQDWAYQSEFVNNVRYYEKVTIPGPFPGNLKVRFLCDAYDNFDYLYLDSIVITGCVGTNKIVEEDAGNASLSDLTENQQIQVFPNPVKDKLFMKIWAQQSELTTIRIFSAEGKVVYESSELSETPQYKFSEIDTREFPPGIYTIQAASSTENLTEKFIVAR